MAFLIGLATGQRRLEERLRALEVTALASSRNSSSPPSTDAPKTRQQRRQEAREKAKELARKDGQRRKVGGQDGHPGAGRELLPLGQMQEVVDHYPEECSGCGREFTDSEKVPRHGPGRHQVAELPATAVVYCEHRTHRLRCPGCQRRTRARLGTVGESAFGPALQAAVVALTARNRISRRDMSELLSELFAVRISVGAIDAICQRTSLLLAGPHERLASQVLGSGAVNIDETGWYLAGENRTMWTAATPQAAIFRIVKDRHRDRLQELLGSEFEGIVTSDRWWAYDLLDPEQRQACWSHLQRDFRFHSEGLAAQQIFGAAGLQLTRRLFETWHAYVRASRPRSARRRDDTNPDRAAGVTRTRWQEIQAPPSSPPVREQPSEALARTVDIHHRPRRHPDQQRCRARSPRTGHPSQALPRQPIRGRRAVHRTIPLRLRSPAAYNTAASSPTSAISSPPTKPAARTPPSSDPQTRRTERLQK